MSNPGVPVTVRLYVPKVAPAATVYVAVKLPPVTEHERLDTMFGLVALFGWVTVHELSTFENPLPVMVTVVPSSEPNGGEPDDGLIVREIGLTVNTATAKSPCSPVTVMVYPCAGADDETWNDAAKKPPY